MSKKAKRSWHDEYRVYEGECESCDYVGKLQIHHKKYGWSGKDKPLYQYSLEELEEMNLIEILCRECHFKRHYTTKLEEYLENNLKHSGPCFVCNKTAKKGWVRGCSEKINKCVCKKCLKTVKLNERNSNTFDGLPKQGTLF